MALFMLAPYNGSYTIASGYQPTARLSVVAHFDSALLRCIQKYNHVDTLCLKNMSNNSNKYFSQGINVTNAD